MVIFHRFLYVYQRLIRSPRRKLFKAIGLNYASKPTPIFPEWDQLNPPFFWRFLQEFHTARLVIIMGHSLSIHPLWSICRCDVPKTYQPYLRSLKGIPQSLKLEHNVPMRNCVFQGTCPTDTWTLKRLISAQVHKWFPARSATVRPGSMYVYIYI